MWVKAQATQLTRADFPQFMLNQLQEVPGCEKRPEHVIRWHIIPCSTGHVTSCTGLKPDRNTSGSNGTDQVTETAACGGVPPEVRLR